nr:nucleoporin NUP100/NSP100-like [Leptinotarsa decemlineata]
MVICKFFLQGTCKFGDFCNFEHQINDSFNNFQNGTSILRKPNFGTTQPQSNFGTTQLQSNFGTTQPQSNFGTPQLQQSKSTVQTSPPSTADTATLVKSVVNDMTSAEKGGQWLLSCYAPFKEKPAFPGFEDQSFEEMRLAYYEAMKSGTLDQYKQQVHMMIQQIQMKIKSLQNPSPDMINLLKNIYNTPPSSQSGVFSGNLFNSPNTTSLNQQGTGFGQQNTSIFAQANQNLFGGTQQQQTTPQTSFGSTGTNIFGTTSQNNVFGGQAISNNPFTTSQPSAQTANTSIFAKNNFSFASAANSVFGVQQAPQQPSGSIFGGNSNASVTAQPVSQQNVFGGQSIFGQPVPQNTGLFNTSSVSQQPQTSIFGSQPPVHTSQTVTENNQAPTNIFGAAAAQTKTAGSIFGQQTGPSEPNPISIFGPTKLNVANQEPNISIFGGSAVASSSVQYDESLYSKLEDLTEEEVKWFQSDSLDINGIPEKPPTFEMCFRT